MKTLSRMTLANVRNNGIKLVVALVFAGAPLVGLGLAQFDQSPAVFAGNTDDVDPG